MNFAGRATAALLCVAFFSLPALAQNAQTYQSVQSALTAALQDRPTSPLNALHDIDQAARDFNHLAASLPPSVVVSGTRTAITNARIAVSRSQTDLEAQVTQVRGLLRRLLYQQLLGNLRAAPASSLQLLGGQFMLSASEQGELKSAVKSGNTDLVVALLERSAANQVVSALEAADPTHAGQSYLQTATALSWFTGVQDSPRADGLSIAGFQTALGQVTARQSGAFAQSRSNLLAHAQHFQDASEVAVQAARQHLPLPQSASAAMRSSTARIQPSGPVPAATPGASLDQALLLALVDAGHGDPVGAKQALQSALAASPGLPARVRAASGYGGFLSHLSSAAASSLLRPADVRALMGSLNNLRRAARGQPQSLLDTLSAAVQRVWSGWLSGVVWLALALLAFYPLYLLNLAFGGRSPYWRAISAALVLLLLPVMLEGLASLGSWLGALSGWGALTDVSLLQSPLAGPVWAVCVALALALASYGFRGLCLQFGLLRQSKSAPAVVQQTVTKPSNAAVEWDEEV